MCSVTCSVYFAPLVCHSLSLSTAMGRRSRWCSYGFRINSHGFLSGNSDDLRSVIDVGSLCVQCTGSKTRDDLKLHLRGEELESVQIARKEADQSIVESKAHPGDSGGREIDLHIPSRLFMNKQGL
ncbi:hypothetical protein SAY87_026759 [Trapa incisa]|uniref:Uncharacterized protein n=1 Tax=Trapa incisa TaxID=236973 RepID=A0AAN7GZW2_9MYRT|nr:hypothetical protein SAY87_026759 [Trapa incisa]